LEAETETGEDVAVSRRRGDEVEKGQYGTRRRKEERGGKEEGEACPSSCTATVKTLNG
jgi:hypothetical protein